MSTAHAGAVRRLARNAFHLLGSGAVQSACGLAATLIAARALGATVFGVLSLISAYALVVTQLVSFQSTYAIVKIGIAAREQDGIGALVGVYRVGLALDFAAAAIAAVIALLGIWVGASWFHFGASENLLTAIFSISIATNAIGAATGVLRICDRYGVIVLHGLFSGFSKLILTAAVWWWKGGLMAFGLALVVSQVLSNVLLIVLGAREAGALKRSTPHSLNVRQTLARFPELRSMLISTNLTATMRMIRDVDVLVIGWLVGASGAGLFRIARQIGSILNKIVDPFFHAIYPDLSQALERRQIGLMRTLIAKSSLMVGGFAAAIFVAMLLLGKRTMLWILGTEYDGAFVAALLCAIGGVIWAFAYPLSPALMAWNRHKLLLHITSTCSIIYLLAVVGGVFAWGVIGGALAYVLFHVTWSVAVAIALARQFRSAQIELQPMP